MGGKFMAYLVPAFLVGIPPKFETSVAQLYTK